MSDAATTLVIPAPLWRRLAAALYDALLLVAVWLSAGLALSVGSTVLGMALSPRFTQACLFMLSFFFFGWFWINGGQTLGMRAWKLSLRREDGKPLNWANAMLRFSAAILSWGLAGVGMLWCLFDRQRRSWHDIVASTEVVVLPGTR